MSISGSIDKWRIAGFHCYDPANSHDKVYVLMISSHAPGKFVVQGWSGPRLSTSMLTMHTKGTFNAIKQAEERIYECFAEREKKGYRPITASDYASGVPFGKRVEYSDLLERCDTSRVVSNASLGDSNSLTTTSNQSSFNRTFDPSILLNTPLMQWPKPTSKTKSKPAPAIAYPKVPTSEPIQKSPAKSEPARAKRNLVL
jgi:hypothetical protein